MSLGRDAGRTGGRLSAGSKAQTTLAAACHESESSTISLLQLGGLLTHRNSMTWRSSR